MALHRPPAGESMISQHVSSPDCPCKPQRVVTTKRRTTGGFGRHQGYKQAGEVYQHNPMPKEG